MLASLWIALLLPVLTGTAHLMTVLNELSSEVHLEPVWAGEQVQLREELLDLDSDHQRRLARGADEDEQQSTFGHSFENEWVTTPQLTDFGNMTKVEDNSSNFLGRSNASTFDPFPLLTEGSLVAYSVLAAAVLVLAVGMVGNMAVMCIVWNNYYMRSSWNYLLACMAFWDFLVLVLCLPVVVLQQLSRKRILSDITCRMVPYMEVASLGITSFTLCALGIDRFHAATSSSQPKVRPVQRCRSVLLKLLLVWLTALVLAAPELFLWQPSEDSCSISTTSAFSLLLPDSLHSLLLRYHQGRMWWCFGCYFCLPILFTILCQAATRNVNSDSSSAHRHRNLDDRSSSQHRAVERELNCTLLALGVAYGMCVLPEHVCNITLAYTILDVSEESAALLELLHHFLLFLKSSVTPVLLLCLCKALGQVFMDCCCCCCQECHPITAQGSPGPAHTKLKATNDSSIFFDKAKDTSAVLSVAS